MSSLLRVQLMRVSRRLWAPIMTAPLDGRVIRLYAKELVDPDFNPKGSVEGWWDGEGWVGAKWNSCHDVWDLQSIAPTHWQEIPDPPEDV